MPDGALNFPGAEEPVTLIVADAAFPFPKLEVIGLVTFSCMPAATPVTFTEKVQEAFATRVAPDRVMLLPPAVAVIVPPPHDPINPFGVDTVNPVGSRS